MYCYMDQKYVGYILSIAIIYPCIGRLRILSGKQSEIERYCGPSGLFFCYTSCAQFWAQSHHGE